MRLEDKIILRVKKDIWSKSVEESGGKSAIIEIEDGTVGTKTEKTVKISAFCPICNHLFEPGTSSCLSCRKQSSLRNADRHLGPPPKLRPFDTNVHTFILFTKGVDVDKLLQTGQFLKYVKHMLSYIPSYVASCAILGMPFSEMSRSAVGGMTYIQVVDHLITLRLDHIQRWLRPVIQKLMMNPKNQNFFNKPVDAIALGIPEYSDIIKQPMDLGTIRSRLQRGLYESAAAVIADVNLVFSNAFLFNPSESVVHQSASILKAEFESEMLSINDKCAKELEKKTSHECSLCQGACCPLCGEVCLKFEPPVLCCHGPCGQKIKKNSIYYVTIDGILVWCQKCYQNLPLVVMEFINNARPPLLKKDILKRKSDEEVAEPWIQCDGCSQWVHQICALYSDRLDPNGWQRSLNAEQGFDKMVSSPVCSPHGRGRRRKTGVSLDDSGRYHCPLCKIEMAAVVSSAIEESDGKPVSFSAEPLDAVVTREVAKNVFSPRRRAMSLMPSTPTSDPAAAGKRRRGQSLSIERTLSSSQEYPKMEFCGSVSTEDRFSAKTRPISPIQDHRSEYEKSDTRKSLAPLLIPHNSPATSTGSHDESESEGPSYSSNDGDSPAGSSAITVAMVETEIDIGEVDHVDVTASSVSEETSGLANSFAPPISQATTRDDHDDEASSFHSRNTEEEASTSSNMTEPSLENSPEVAESKMQSDVVECEDDAMTVVSDSANESDTVKAPQSVTNDGETRVAESVGTTNTVIENPAPRHPPSMQESIRQTLGGQFKATALPKTQLSDYLESMISDRLNVLGFGDAASSISIRVCSNTTHSFDVAEPLYSNFLSREGTHLPTTLSYKQKCILLFQQTDGVDVCLFCLYVQEFGKECPPPNNSVIYIAYIDSIDYFRPMEARTSVYHEIIVGYLSWAQVYFL
jgi:hypothetical protein